MEWTTRRQKAVFGVAAVLAVLATVVFGLLRPPMWSSSAAVVVPVRKPQIWTQARIADSLPVLVAASESGPQLSSDVLLVTVTGWTASGAQRAAEAVAWFYVALVGSPRSPGGPVADRGIPLDLVDCPDRRIDRAAAELVARQHSHPGTHVTVVLSRRSSPPLLGRLPHDRTADKIARLVSRIPGSAAMIIPFDVSARIEMLHERHADARAAPDQTDAARPDSQAGPRPISSLTSHRQATVDGPPHAR